jgi:hypothetical protein
MIELQDDCNQFRLNACALTGECDRLNHFIPFHLLDLSTSIVMN